MLRTAENSMGLNAESKGLKPVENSFREHGIKVVMGLKQVENSFREHGIKKSKEL